jgi:hypothetical protein
MSNASLHAQVLLLLSRRIAGRQREHEGKCGMGLEDRDYQRHVGRIAECKAILKEVEELMKADIDDIEDLQEEERNSEHQSDRAKKRRP